MHTTYYYCYTMLYRLFGRDILSVLHMGTFDYNFTNMFSNTHTYGRRKLFCIDSVYVIHPASPSQCWKWGYKGVPNNLCIIFSAYGTTWKEDP